MELIIASHNENKILEFKKKLGKKFLLKSLSDIGFEDDILSYLQEPAKSDIDFIENCINSHSKYSTCDTQQSYL